MDELGGNKLIILNEQEIQANYRMSDAIKDVQDILQKRHIGKIINPQRTVIEYPEAAASVLFMPSSDTVNKLATMKTVSIFPENAQRGDATTQGVTLVTDANNGNFLALLNASYLTRLRTGALSGIATDLLAREKCEVLTVIGTGGMAFEQVLGVLEVRNIKKIILVNPTESKAHVFKEKLISFGIRDDIEIEIERDVSVAVKLADIINCSTRSFDPVFDGNDVKPGTHVNGVGSYLPQMKEVDLTFIKRASKIVVDDLEGAKDEAGELIHAAKQPDWSFEKLHGELQDLHVGDITKRESDSEITFFKSVGAAYYDLAVANGIYQIALTEKLGTTVTV